MAKEEEKTGFWRKFLRLSSDGWLSRFESVDLLLEHLRGMTRSTVSRDRYCYNLWVVCVWVTLQVKRSPPEEKASQQTLNGGKSDEGLSSQKKRWMEIAESLSFDIINPEQLVSMARENPDQVARLIRMLALEYYESESLRYANHILALADTFFKVNKVDLTLECFSMRGRSRERKRQEYIPTLGEALKMADVAGSLRNRLIILFLTYTGSRNSTLRAQVYNEVYQDPLYQDYTIKKQLQRGESCLTIIVDKVMKKRVPGACKNNVSYYTFIPPTVTEYLRLYLRELEEKYGPLRDDQPIFHTENRRLPLAQRLMTPLSDRELQVIIKDAARKAGIKLWRFVYPHCLRKTFESFLRNQPDDVRLDDKEREFLFGHLLPGSQDVYFDKTKIEEMRSKYARMVFEPVISVEREERVIGEDELQSFLQQGWHFEATLSSGKVVVWRKSVVKQISEKGVKSQTQPVLEKLEQNQPSSSQDIVSNRIMQQSSNQAKNKGNIQKTSQSQKLDYIEAPKITEEKDVKTSISERASLDSFFKSQQEVLFNHEDDNKSKDSEQGETNAVSQGLNKKSVYKSKQRSILNYVQ